MAEISRTIITELANLEDAVVMSIFAPPEGSGIPQANFVGRARDTPDGAATHCMASGFMSEEIIARYEMDPRFFVSEHVARQWPQALLEHDPVLYRMP